ARSLAQAMEDIRTGRKTFSFSEPGLKSRRLDGEEFEFEAALSCAQVGGRPLYTIYLRDLGERRRLESEQHRLQLQSAYLQEEIKAVHNFEEIVGRSAVLQRVLSQVDLVAATDSSVLISGETGTGKELVARAIHAPNPALPAAVADGTFRQDLYYRLNVFPVTLPPLRERPEDIPPLVHYFVARYRAKIGRKISCVPQETMARLAAYAWPGNVRELENVIERAVILSPGTDLEV